MYGALRFGTMTSGRERMDRHGCRFHLATAAIAGGIALVCGLLATTVPAAADALSSLTDKDFVGARDEAAKIVAKDNRNPRALMVLGWSEFSLGNYDAAEKAFRSLERIDDKNFDALLGLAWTHIKLARFTDAEAYLRKAEARAEAWQRYQVVDARGWMALDRGDLAQAESLFRNEDGSLVSGQKRPDDPMVGLGWTALKRNKLAEARTHFREGLNRNVHECFYCYDGLARVALAEGKLDEALKSAVKGGEIARHNPGLVALIDTILAAKKNPAESIKVYKSLAGTHKKDALYAARLGWAYLAINDAKEARDAFARALKATPDDAVALAGMRELKGLDRRFVATAWEAYWRGDYEAALKACESKREEAKRIGNAAAEDCRGWALLGLGRPKDAVVAFRAALAIDKAFFYSDSGLIAAQQAGLGLYGQAWALLDAGRLDEAAAMFRRAGPELERDKQWLVADGLGWVAYYRKNYDEAEKAFRQVLATTPEAYLSQKGLGNIALERKDFAGAVKALTASLTRSPYQVLASYTVPAAKLLEARQFAEARDILTLGERVYPVSADVQWLLAKALLGLRDETGAAARAVRAATLAPTYIHPVFDQLALPAARARDAYQALGWGLYFAGNHAAALERFDRYVQAGGTDPNARRGRGFTLFRLARYQDAAPELTAAASDEEKKGLAGIEELVSMPGTAQRWPIVYNARSTLAWLYYRTNEPARAETEFRAVLDAHPFWVDALTGLGYTLAAQNKLKDAEQKFRTALQVSPAYPDANRGLATLKTAK